MGLYVPVEQPCCYGSRSLYWWGCCIHWVGYALLTLSYMVCACTLNLVNFLGPLTLNAKLKGQKVILDIKREPLSIECVLPVIDHPDHC